MAVEEHKLHDARVQAAEFGRSASFDPVANPSLVPAKIVRG